MRYIVFPKTGLKISVIGLGFWQIGSPLWGSKGISVERVRAIVSNAYGSGINLYDTAEIYGWGKSEEALGSVVKELKIRDDIVIISKIAGFRHSYDDMIKSAKNIVKRLGTYPDVLLHHWPPPVYVDICKVIHNFERIIDLGLAHYYGLSNYGEDSIEKVLSCIKKYEPVADQLHYNLGYRVIENNLEKTLRKENILIMAWSPLAKGSLAGLKKPKTIIQKTDKVFKTIAQDQLLQKKLRELSEKYGVKQSTIALAWIISHNVIPIPGTSKPERVREYSMSGKILLSHEDIKELDMITNKYKYIWGKKYNALKKQKYIPGVLQKIAIWLIGGI